MNGADGLWHSRTELDHPGLHSVWSQVTDFPEDDIYLREARALFRGLQVMVCAEHVRNARVLCLTDSVSCSLAFERRRARNFFKTVGADAQVDIPLPLSSNKMPRQTT